MAPLVLDSSSLITLGRGAALDLLAPSPHQALTVAEVYRETVEVGLAKGRPDSAECNSAFERGLITLQEPRRAEKLAGISLADSLVLHLAEEVRAGQLLTNDKTLFRKAEERGLPVADTAAFVQDLHVSGRIPRERRDSLLKDFVARGRYTAEFMQAFLLGR